MAADELSHACYSRATDLDSAKSCMDGAVKRMMGCTQGLLENLWAKWPDVKVGQYNYVATQMDELCQEENCMEASAEFIGGQFCLSTYVGGGVGGGLGGGGGGLWPKSSACTGLASPEAAAARSVASSHASCACACEGEGGAVRRGAAGRERERGGWRGGGQHPL